MELAQRCFRMPLFWSTIQSPRDYFYPQTNSQGLHASPLCLYSICWCLLHSALWISDPCSASLILHHLASDDVPDDEQVLYRAPQLTLSTPSSLPASLCTGNSFLTLAQSRSLELRWSFSLQHCTWPLSHKHTAYCSHQSCVHFCASGNSFLPSHLPTIP